MKQLLVVGLCLLALLSWGVRADEAVWIDTCSYAENLVDSIEGDPQIAHDEIVAGVAALGLAPNTTIKLYCRSGGRAGQAMAALQEAGYSQVENAGGIDDARRARGLPVD